MTRSRARAPSRSRCRGCRPRPSCGRRPSGAIARDGSKRRSRVPPHRPAPRRPGVQSARLWKPGGVSWVTAVSGIASSSRERVDADPRAAVRWCLARRTGFDVVEEQNEMLPPGPTASVVAGGLRRTVTKPGALYNASRSACAGALLHTDQGRRIPRTLELARQTEIRCRQTSPPEIRDDSLVSGSPSTASD